MKNNLYAEDINYWKTSRTSPDSWIEKAKRQIEKLGGKIITEAFGHEAQTGRSAYMLEFEIHGNRFKAIWPVMPSKNNEEKAARIQAATMLYHDIKSKCLGATVKGPRTAFFEYLVLPTGQVVSQISDDSLADAIPKLLVYSQK